MASASPAIVREARYLQRNGTSEVTVQLNPPDLGRMKIAVQMRDGKLDVTISVENSQVREAMRSELDGLGKNLKDAQLDLNHVEVSDYAADARGELGEGIAKRDSGAPATVPGAYEPEPGAVAGTWAVFTKSGGVDCLI
jgi:hypothetical protein